VSETALANYVVNSDPKGIDHGLKQKPMLAFPTMRSGANTESLHEFQQHFLRSSPLHETVHGQYSRCPDWRPLTEQECRETAGTPETGREYFEASGAEEPEYY
jgi:hypothetical protein